MSSSNSVIRIDTTNSNGEITLSQVLSAFFYLATLAVIGYYLWMWWQNTKRLKENIRAAVSNSLSGASSSLKEGFSDPLALEVPKATQSKTTCNFTDPMDAVEPVWDAAEDGHILYDESQREWSNIKLGKQKFTKEVNLAFSNLQDKYVKKIDAKIKDALPELEKAGLTKYIPKLSDLDNPITGDSTIAQLKGTITMQITNLKAVIVNIEAISKVSGQNGNKYRELWARKDDTGQSFIPDWAQSELSQEEIVRRIIRNESLRQYLEKKMENLPDKETLDIYSLIFKSSSSVAQELIDIAAKLVESYEKILPVIDAIIGLRADYTKERKEIMDLVAELPFGNVENGQVMESDGGPGQVPPNIINSNGTRNDPLGRLGRFPERYWLNKWSGKKYELTRQLDSSSNKISGLTNEEFNQKYDWVNKIGKDVIPVENDPEIKYLLPPNMRTIPDILSDYDHYNANCQRIYGECSTRSDVPGFPLPNWQPKDYYDYLDRLPDAKAASAGEIPVI